MIDAHQRSEAYRMAALGLGWENISVKLGIRDDARQSAIRDIVLRKPMPKVPQDVMFANARPRAQTLRTRQLGSIANRKSPITLPTLSILRDEQ